MPKAEHSYDPACEELARHFLQDVPCQSLNYLPDLAQAIQRAVEEWLENEVIHE